MAAYRAMQKLRHRMVWLLGANVFQRMGQPAADRRVAYIYAATDAEHENSPHGAKAMSKPYPTIEEVRARIREGDPSFGITARTRDIIKAACDLDREHREVAEVERIDWADIPWATCVSKDSTGQCYGYKDAPTLGEHFWKPASDRWEWIDATIPGPWQESLRARPESV